MRIRGVQRWMAEDLWCAVGLDGKDFDLFWETEGFGSTWAQLLQHVMKVSGTYRECSDPECVLREHDPAHPHYEAQDVGTSAPLPFG